MEYYNEYYDCGAPETKVRDVVFIGDGVYDWLSMKNADYSICTIDALSHVVDCSDHIIFRTGADRFVAEACIHIMEKYELIKSVYELGVKK